MYAIGTKICYVKTQWSANVEQRFVSRGHTVTKIHNKDSTIWIDNQHKPEDCLFAVFAYPDLDECVNFLQAGLDLAAKHKKESDEHYVYTLQYNNDLIRRGLK